jgi:two-component system CheB/CheR fusion protein
VARHVGLREVALEHLPLAQVIVDPGGTVVVINKAARALLSLTDHDLGRPLQDLQLSYRPVELRSLIEEATADRRPVQRRAVERVTKVGETEYLDVRITPLADEVNTPLGVIITFEDVTEYKRLRDDVERSHQALETTSEELQSTNEELETANEELQSTVEELETTNEELQSANEELETMNEELESTNEELQTINEELRDRSEAFDSVNSFLNTILGSLRVAVVVINRDYSVQTWNRRAEDLWGLRSDEVEGQPLFDLDFGLPVGEIRAAVRACLIGKADYHEVVTSAMTRRGRTIDCRVICTPLLDGHDRQGVVILMEEGSESVAQLG